MTHLTKGYLSLGLLIGLLTGLTSAPISNTVILALFALIGGSVTYVVEKLQADRVNVGKALTAFSLACVVALLLGVVIKVNGLLVWRTIPGFSPASPLLMEGMVSEANHINTRYVNRDIGGDQAYRELWELIHRPGPP